MPANNFASINTQIENTFNNIEKDLAEISVSSQAASDNFQSTIDRLKEMKEKQKRLNAELTELLG